MYQRIKYFLAVAHYRNFTVAAENMFISQQAITRQIALLEEELGVKLFNRTTRSVELTPAGEICQNEFAKIDLDLSAAVNRIQKAAIANSDIMTIGFYQFFSRSRIITPIMTALYQHFPNMELRIRLHDFRELRYNLLDGKLDLCIAMASDWQYWTLAKVTKLCQLNINLVVSHDHPLAAYEQLPLEELSKYPRFTVKNLDTLRPYPTFWSSNIPCQAKIAADNISTVLAYVHAGRGFTCQPPVFSGSDHTSLCLFPLPFQDATLDFFCACRSDMINPQVLRVEKYIQKNFSKIFPHGI